jgi:hypothetical protein
VRGLIVTWGVAEGIIIWRSARQGKPPLPYQLLVSSGAFVLLAILAEGAPTLAATIGVGLDFAALLNLAPIAPPGTSGQTLTTGTAATPVATTTTPAKTPVAA